MNITSTITTEFVIEPPNVEHLITESDFPIINIFSEKQQRLLVDTLYSSTPFGERAFVASQKKQRPEQEKQYAQKLADKLRELGINPEEV